MGEENTGMNKVFIDGVEFKGIQDIEFNLEPTNKEGFNFNYPSSFSGTLIMDRKTSKKVRRKMKRFLFKQKIKNLIPNIFKQ